MARPLYRQIAEELRRQIEAGELARGTRLPTENEFQKQYSASRNTIREAIKYLAVMGLVETRPGQGTFVAAELGPVVVNLGAAADDGAAALPVAEIPASARMESTTPHVEIQPAVARLAAELRLPEGETVVSRHQRQFIDSTPWSLQTTFYPMDLVLRGASRLLSPEAIAEGTVQYLRDTLGVTEAGWRDRLTIRPADENEIAFFRLPPNGRVGIAEVFRTAYDQVGAPMRLMVSVFPADRNSFVVSTGAVPGLALEGPPPGSPDPAGRQGPADRTPAIFSLER
jgi:GntR family transcriptional regulator